MSDALTRSVRPRAPRILPARVLPARVRWAAWYFEFAGGLGLLVMSLALVTRLLGVGPAATMHVSALAVVLGAITNAGLLLTGRLLAAGERRGAVVAAATLLIPVLARLTGQGGSLDSIVIGVVGAVAVLSAWRDLR